MMQSRFGHLCQAKKPCAAIVGRVMQNAVFSRSTAGQKLIPSIPASRHACQEGHRRRAVSSTMKSRKNLASVS